MAGTKKKKGEDAWFTQVLADIKGLRIQGASNVAIAGVKAAARYHAEHGSVAKAIKELLATRPTEPMLQNALAYYERHATKENCKSVATTLLTLLAESQERSSDYAAGLVKSWKSYFTHCHSSTVVSAFKKAHGEGKKFIVHNTETRPLLQGRQTATELSKTGITIVHAVDSATRVNLKECAAVFLGADALLGDGNVVNKIGSEMVAELAFNREIPVYVIANSWKYDRRGKAAFKGAMEKRAPEEVWDRAPKRVRVLNPAFEVIKPKYLTAVITELGIYDPRTTVKLVRQRLALRQQK